MLSFHRDYNEIPYWLNNNLWLKFLINDDFDHTYFIDIFKTIVEDYKIRNEVLEYFLSRNDDDDHHNHEGVSDGFRNDYYYHNHNHNQEISNSKNYYHHLLSSSSTILFNKYYPKQSQTQRLVEIQRIWKLSKSVNKIAYITYEYPGIIVDQTG
jgi:hypothetical protein